MTVTTSSAFVFWACIMTLDLDEDGLYAAEVRSKIPLLEQNCRNSPERNCGPLSDTMIFGKPHLLKMSSADTVVLPHELVILTTSGNFLQASTTTRSVYPEVGPAKSLWIWDHGRPGNAQDWVWKLQGSARTDWQVLHNATVPSIWESI